MTAKEWFQHARYCKDKIKSLERLKIELLSDAVQTTHVPKLDVVQTSARNGTEERYANYVVEAGDIDRQIERLRREKRDVIDVIYAIDNPKYQELLSLRYLQNKTWEDVASEMGYDDVRNVYRLHIRAVSAAEPIIRYVIKKNNKKFW